MSWKVRTEVERWAADAGDASRNWAVRDSLLVILEGPGGIVGVGEAAPLPGRSADTLAAAHAVLTKWAKTDPAPNQHTSVEQTLAAVSENAWTRSSPSARFAIETALLDALSQMRGVPVHRLIAQTVLHPSEREQASSVPLSALVADPEPTRWLAATKAHVKDGFQTVKYKVGRNWQAELAALRHVGRSFPDLKLRLDANRMLDASAFLDAKKTLRDLRIEFVEEPVPKTDLGRVGEGPISVAIDETIAEGHFEPLEFPAVVVGVVKPTVIGGVVESVALATKIRQHGVDPVVSHALEGAVALTACAELAVALRSSRAAGLAPHGAMANDALDGVPVFAGAELVAHEHAGLGVGVPS